MLDRNRKIKRAPQRFRDTKEVFDVIVCCEERCYDQVCEDISNRGEDLGRLVHVINFDIKDNHEDATIGAKNILQLCQMVRGPFSSLFSQTLNPLCVFLCVDSGL